MNIFVSEMEGKRIGLLRDLVPSAELIGVLLNPGYSVFGAHLKASVHSKVVQSIKNLMSEP